HTPVPHPKRFGRPIGGALTGQCAAGWIVAVFHPVTHFRGRARTDVGGEVGLGIDQAAELDELVSAEAIVFDVTAPVDVDALQTFLRSSDAVAPVIVIGETAAGPAKNRDT